MEESSGVLGVCPKCGGNSVMVFGPADLRGDGDEAECDGECFDCGILWTNVYTLTAQEDVRSVGG
jgi:hypothetical protein